MCLTIVLLASSLISPGDITIESFKEQYRDAINTLINSHRHIFVLESIHFQDDPADKTTWTNARVCDDNVVVMVSRGVSATNGGCQLLNGTFTMTLNYSTKTNKWSVASHVPLTDDRTRNYQKGQIRGLYPHALWWPYCMPNGWLTVGDILAGSSKSRRASPNLTFTISKIESLRHNGINVFRLHFIQHVPDPTGTMLHDPCYVDVAPDLGWQIVGGRYLYHEEWAIEYGDPINGIPIMKKATYWRIAPQWVRVPVFEVLVHHAEPCTKVDETFEPSYYGVNLSDLEARALVPNESAEVPLILYVGLAGMLCFIVGVLLLARAQARTKRLRRADDASAPG